jgi:hypothetical protein
MGGVDGRSTRSKAAPSRIAFMVNTWSEGCLGGVNVPACCTVS